MWFYIRACVLTFIEVILPVGLLLYVLMDFQAVY